MNILILIVVAIAGIVLGAYFARRRGNRSGGQARRRSSGLVTEQSEKKRENKEKILEFLNKKEKVTNNDVEKLLGVSDATATRYLDELEKEGKVRQVGTTGQSVFYVLK